LYNFPHIGYGNQDKDAKITVRYRRHSIGLLGGSVYRVFGSAAIRLPNAVKGNETSQKIMGVPLTSPSGGGTTGATLHAVVSVTAGIHRVSYLLLNLLL
jgi:hypothetical protein